MKLVITILSILAAIAMFLSGIAKLVGSGFRDDMVSTFAIGGNEIGGWFFILVGIAEIGIALWLLYPPFRDAGGAALLIVMIGALVFNLALVRDVLPEGIDDPSGFWPVNIILGLVGLAIAVMWPRLAPEAVAGTVTLTK